MNTAVDPRELGGYVLSVGGPLIPTILCLGLKIPGSDTEDA